MERLRGYINSVCDANERARILYMSLSDNYNQFHIEKIINDTSIFQWIQTWGSTACGFPGMGGAAMTSAECVVVEFNSMYTTYLGIACVYHNGRFAYSCKIDDEYKEFVKVRRMPGQSNVKRSKLNLINVHKRDEVKKFKDEREAS